MLKLYSIHFIWMNTCLPNEYNQHFKTCYTCIIFCSIFGYFMKYFVALPSEPNGHTVPDSASRSWGWWWGPFFFTSCVCSSLLRLLLLNVGMNKVWSSGKRSQVFGLGSPKIWRFSNLFAIYLVDVDFKRWFFLIQKLVFLEVRFNAIFRKYLWMKMLNKVFFVCLS